MYITIFNARFSGVLKLKIGCYRNEKSSNDYYHIFILLHFHTFIFHTFIFYTFIFYTFIFLHFYIYHTFYLKTLFILYICINLNDTHYITYRTKIL